MKDDALSPAGFLMETLPIAVPSNEVRESAESRAGRLVTLKADNQEAKRDLLDWLRLEHGVHDPGAKLQNPWRLSSDDFVTEAKKGHRPKKILTPAELESLREEHARSVAPRQALLAEAAVLERELAHLVNEAYGLTPEEIALLWQTAPPRMPAVPT